MVGVRECFSSCLWIVIVFSLGYGMMIIGLLLVVGLTGPLMMGSKINSYC